MVIGPHIYTQLALAFAGALMGALFGGFVRWGEIQRDRRLQLALDLYAEFHSPVFYHIRELAHKTLEQYGSMPAAYQAAQGEAREALASLVHFWEKAAQLVHIRAVDERLMRRFFGQYARWWSVLLCADQVALADSEWGVTLTDINWLFGRLKKSKREGSRR